MRLIYLKGIIVKRFSIETKMVTARENSERDRETWRQTEKIE